MNTRKRKRLRFRGRCVHRKLGNLDWRCSAKNIMPIDREFCRKCPLFKPVFSFAYEKRFAKAQISFCDKQKYNPPPKLPRWYEYPEEND